MKQTLKEPQYRMKAPIIPQAGRYSMCSACDATGMSSGRMKTPCNECRLFTKLKFTKYGISHCIYCTLDGTNPHPKYRNIKSQFQRLEMILTKPVLFQNQMF